MLVISIKKSRVAAIMLAVLFASPAVAAEKLYSPYVEKGEWELEYFGSRTNDGDATKDNAQDHQFSIGYGVNDWWRTELYAKYEKEPQDENKFNQVEWENIFQLTERGEYWLDIGASISYEYTPQTSKPDTIETRLLLEKDTEKTSHILNLIVEKDVGAGPKEGVEAGFMWSSRYNLTPYFEPGFEIDSNFGELKDTGGFNDQEHYAGPVAYGKIPLEFTERNDALEYRVGYLFGISDAASNGEAVLQVEYELRF